MVGQVSKFELWDDDTWSARRDELLSQVGALQAEPSDALRGLVL